MTYHTPPSDRPREERGLWVGIHVPKSVVPRGNAFYDMMPIKEPHITLAHLGRHSSPDYVNKVQRVLIGACVNRSLEAEITGWGVFLRGNYSLKVALINSAGLFQLRGEILKALYDADVEYDTKFGFIPHITLSSNALPWEQKTTSFRFVTDHPVLVWGDERLSL